MTLYFSNKVLLHSQTSNAEMQRVQKTPEKVQNKISKIGDSGFLSSNLYSRQVHGRIHQRSKKTRMPYITNIEEEKLAMASRGCSRLIGYRVRVPVGVGQVTIRASPGNSLGPLIRAKTHIENIRHNGCNPDSSGSSQNARNGLVLKVISAAR